MKIKVCIFALLGLLSGVLSVEIIKISDFFLFFGPGLIFGVLMSFLLYCYFRRSIFFHLAYIAISTAAYFLAVISSMTLEKEEFLSFFVASFVGSLILVIGLRFKYKIPLVCMVLFILVGEVSILLSLSDVKVFLFPIWQTFTSVAVFVFVNDGVEQIIR